MGYEYCQQFNIAHLLEGRTIDMIKFTDYEGEVGLSIMFTDGSDLYICGDHDEEIWTLIFGSTSNWDNRDRCQLDTTGYWGRRRGEWRKEDPGWKDRGKQ